MPPIVALVSFNSAMSGGPACFGLRIIFGALKCMGILDATSTWVEFCAIHMNHARGISAIQAVKLLRMVLGHDRRVLVCVDELSKAEFAAEDLPAMSRPDKTAEVAIMTELARLLEQDGKCDIVVSTPSPQYIDELTYGSNRPIIYLPVEPLQGTVAEYSRAAEVLIQNCARGLAGKRNPVFKLRMLRSGYLLASGHPRTIEGLVDNLEKSTNFSQTITKALCDEGVTSSDFLEEMFACPCFQITLAASTSEELQCVLSDEESMFTAKEYRYYLERPLVHIHSATYKGFRVTTTLSAFFSAVRWAENCVKGAAAAQPPPRNVQFLTTIFSYVLDKNRKPGKSALPEMWERSRALNVAMFALSRSKCTFCRLSGKAVRSRTMSVELTDVRIATAAITYHNGVLFVADEGQSGFDFLVCGVDEGGKPAYLYEEVKLYESKPLLDIIAEKIRLTLADHWASRAPPTTVIEADEFQRIAFVLSRYADATSEENTSLQSYQAVLQNMQTKLDTESDAQKRQDWERAMRYVQQPEVWEMNVGFLFKEELEATMIPVTLTIAKLALKVQDEVK